MGRVFMTSAQYGAMLRQLYRKNLQDPQSIRMGLSNTQKLYNLVGQPLKNTPVIHVGGSTGKGSVCYKLAETLRQNGFKTGLFVSPHISSYRERIQVNAQVMDVETMATILPKLLSVCEKEKINASFFELTTILALLAFDRACCDAVVLEVGLGGRLDATNVIPNPILSIITNIQLEHTRILGKTLPEIAYSKAGIAKRGCPLLLGFGSEAAFLQQQLGNLDQPNLSATSPASAAAEGTRQISEESIEVIQVMHDEAQRVGASSVTHVADYLQDRKYLAGKTKNIDVINGDIAVTALRLIERGTTKIPGSDTHERNVQSFRRNLASKAVNFDVAYDVRPPCRFQTITIKNTRGAGVVDVILDVAHTHDAIASLCEKVREMNSPDVHVVIGMCVDKNVRKCIEHVTALVGPGKHRSNVHCVSSAQKRMNSVKKLKEIVLEVAGDTSAAGADWARIESDSTATNADRDEEKEIRIALRQAIDKASATRAVAVTTEESGVQRPVVLVCGSAFIMASVRDEIGINGPPRDPLQ